MRRSLPLAAAAALLSLTLMVSAMAAEPAGFNDVEPGTDLGQAVERMAGAGVINGKPGGVFDPEGGLTRAEFVKIANLVYGYTTPADTGFTDVPETHWAYPYVMAAKAAGYIQGDGGGAFLPDQPVTKEQFCVMVGRINKFENLLGLTFDIKDEVSPWAKQAVESALACGLFTLSEDGKFGGTLPVTRAETVLSLEPYVAAKDNPTSSPTTTPSPTPTESTPSGGGGGGGGGDTPDNGHSTEEEEIVGYLKKMVDTFNGMSLNQYTNDATVKESANTLMSYLKEALRAHDSGTELTRAYLESTYADQIDSFRTQYNEMDKDQRNDIQIIVADLAPSYELDAVMDYFGIDIKI